MKHATRLLAAVTLSLVAGAASAQVQLTPKRAEGKVVSQDQFKFTQLLKIAGQEVPTEVESQSTTAVETGKPGPDGNRRVVYKTEKLAMKITAPGAELTFDSARPDEAKSGIPELQAVADFLKALVSAPYTLVVNPRNEVTAVEGVDKILEKATPAAAEVVQDELKLEKLKREDTQELASLPDRPVNKGDRWQRTEIQDIGAGQLLTLDTHYEYAGTVEKDGKMLDKVTLFVNGVKYDQKEDFPGGLKVVRSDLKVGGSSGYYLFDRATGRMVERVSNTRVTGGVTMSVNGMELPAELDLTMDIHTRRH